MCVKAKINTKSCACQELKNEVPQWLARDMLDSVEGHNGRGSTAGSISGSAVLNCQ
jgi:hypothetical protein